MRSEILSGPPINICKNCLNEVPDQYCGRCGEKVIDDHERTFIHFVKESVHALTHADGKIFKSLKGLITSPGRLSKYYVDGIRNVFMKPIALFFVCNLMYFISPSVNLFMPSLGKEIPGGSVAKPIIERKLKERDIDYITFREKFNARIPSVSKLLLILFVPLFAAALALINYGRREFFADHIAVSLEFMSFILFYLGTLAPLLVKGYIAMHNHFSSEAESLNYFSLDWPGGFMILYFLFRSERKFYETKILSAAVRSLVLTGSWLAITLLVYNQIVFFITLVAV